MKKREPQKCTKSHLSDLFQSLVVLQEESQPLVGYVDLAVSAQLPVLLHGGLATGEGVLVDLVLDLLGGVGEKYRGVAVARGHLRLRTLQRREEAGMHQSRLGEAQSRRHVSGHTEVRILIDRARYQAVHLGVLEDKGERTGDRRRRLRRRKGDLADRIAVAETEDALHLIERHTSLYPNHILVEGRIVPYVLQIGEDKGLVGIKAARDNVFRVGVGQFYGVLYLYVLPYGFLIVRQLYNQGNVEHVLQPFAEHERYEVAQMHRVGTRSSTCVQVKRLSLFVEIQNGVHVSVREEYASPEKVMRLPAGDLLESG